MVLIMKKYRYSGEWYVKKTREWLVENPVFKKVLDLFLQGYTYSEISKMLNIPYKTVTTYVYMMKRGKLITPITDFTILRRKVERIIGLVGDLEVSAINMKYDRELFKEVKKELNHVLRIAKLLEARYQTLNR